MIKLKGIIFEDDETKSEIKVNIMSHEVISDQELTFDEKFTCIFNAGLIANGGFEATKKFYTKQ